MRVLIIDDEANIRRTTAVALDAMGHEPVGVETAAAALKQVEGGHFDVVLLDLKLDGESGLDLLPELLKRDPQLEVVVFTAYDPTALPVVESLLLANDIPYVVNNELGQDVVGFGRVAGYNLALGPPVVTVPAAYEQRARELIESTEPGIVAEDAAGE